MPAYIQLAFTKEGKCIHISKAVKKSGAIYYCDECHGQLICKQGEKRDWHYAHKNISNCQGGRETAIHKLAKQVIAENSRIKLLGTEEATYHNTKIEETYYNNTIRPDVTIICSDDKEIHLEFYVTHKKGEREKKIYKDNKARCIEIDLSEWIYKESWTYEEFKDHVLLQSNNKTEIGWQKISESQTQPQSDPLNSLVLIIIAGFFSLLLPLRIRRFIITILVFMGIYVFLDMIKSHKNNYNLAQS